MKAFAKANVFLKITGLREDGYHLLQSRFVLVESLFDELVLSKEKTKSGFELISEFNCDDNIIIKAYELLRESGFKNELDEFFKNQSLVLKKNIPVFSGLGGGSSDAACFLLLMNEELNLKLTKKRLKELGLKLGADVSFFLSGFKSANVSGVGEEVAEFEEDLPRLDFTFPKISCATNLVYKEFDKGPFDFKASLKAADELKALKTREILEHKNSFLNDLFTPCVNLYPKMSAFLEQNFFLSGSGSTVFKVGE